MKIPLEVTFRNVATKPSLHALIERQAEHLSKACHSLSSCRVAVEQPHHHHRHGNRYRVRIDLTVPPCHELVVDHEPEKSEHGERLPTVVREAFAVARRQLRALVERQRGQVKSHEGPNGFVVRIDRQAGFGFLKSVDGRDIYFHANSVLGRDWGALQLGTGVRFVEELGEDGPQASTVHIVDKPGARVPPSGDAAIPAPLGWGGRIRAET